MRTIDRRKFLIRTSSLGVAAAAGGFAAGAREITAAVDNPYAGIPDGASWLKGEIHTHVNRAPRAPRPYGDGPSAAAVYRSAAAEGIDFVCMSVEVAEANGGMGHFGDIGADDRRGVIGIPGREIQNNLYGRMPYFTEPGAAYLHVLTVGEAGVNIVAHPRFYDMVGGESGTWRDIKSALLAPRAGGALAQVTISGIEIYNGYTLAVLKQRGNESQYRDFDESCWDEMLMAGRLYWGFASNDAFVESRDYQSISPLGCVHAAVTERSPEAIVAALRRGRFYSSTGITLPSRPIAVGSEGTAARIAVEANEVVDWTAYIHCRGERGWMLEARAAPTGRTAVFLIETEWKYVRIQCRSVTDPWRRAWLQPLANPALFT